VSGKQDLFKARQIEGDYPESREEKESWMLLTGS